MERIKNGRVKTPDQYNWHYEDNGLVIDESFFAPTRLRVLQLAITWSAAPTVSNSFTVYKNSVWGNPYNVLLYSVDPSTGALNLTDDVCVIPWIFEREDTARFSFQNPEQVAVSFEMMLEEIIDNRDEFAGGGPPE